MARVLVTGSRSGPAREFVWAVLDQLTAEVGYAGLTLVDGACPDGTDLHTKLWCQGHRHLGVIHEPHPANWDSCAWDCPQTLHRRWKRTGDRHHPGILPDYCPTAGPRRNALLVGLGADLCLGFPVGPTSYGTRNCMRLAREAGIPVQKHEIHPRVNAPAAR
ncbi:SLOG family protein [Kitasatospora cineracea]|uniref:Uncharacterized protein DUF2493 n=1 Tax=Kitasatospora cineracea TaxID=88074 RepID=A0A3N4R1Q1_9ACTN|nr:SLOG family protein [Kitasatospora cineracea]RPE27258.1 uncharacterized protein DUF2493 [Kitasatospora cineracea]